MQKDSSLPCFAAFGEQTASQLRDRFQQGLTQFAVEEHVQRLIDTSLGSNWTRLYDSVRRCHPLRRRIRVLTSDCDTSSTNTIRSLSCDALEGYYNYLLRLLDHSMCIISDILRCGLDNSRRHGCAPDILPFIHG